MAITRCVYFQDDVSEKIRLEPNASALINELLRQHYKVVKKAPEAIKEVIENEVKELEKQVVEKKDELTEWEKQVETKVMLNLTDDELNFFENNNEASLMDLKNIYNEVFKTNLESIDIIFKQKRYKEFIKNARGIPESS